MDKIKTYFILQVIPKKRDEIIITHISEKWEVVKEVKENLDNKCYALNLQTNYRQELYAIKRAGIDKLGDKKIIKQIEKSLKGVK